MRASCHHQQRNLTGSFSSSFITKNTTKQQGKMRNIGDGKKTIIRSAAKNDDANEISFSEKDDEHTTNKLTKREFGMKTFAFTSLSLFASSSSSQTKEAFADDSLNSNFWEKVNLPLEPGVILLDIAFTDENARHGFLLGTRQTILETFDGGKTWDAKDLGQDVIDDEVNYRFNSVSFNGDEGWIVGKPAILLHTVDAGKTWERVGLSPRLPGIPVLITATGDNGVAEMVTDQGAIYLTTDAARNWKAAVEETVDATLNRTVSSGVQGASYYTGSFSTVSRNPETGEYIGLSSRGNFYMSWAPGQAYWQPHNRSSARRIQSMGWRKDGGVWQLTRGGGIYLSDTKALPEEDDEFTEGKIGSRGYGLLDLGSNASGTKYFTVGGSGSVFSSEDKGKTWKRDRGTDEVAGNLYKVAFAKDDVGFILGNDGILLRYRGSA
ncbi:unnamed protein product [Bathycoccus prasinos]|mmetsp:Transcript_6929/g.21564  ORF Transcript_6929/g.21564 Transcript_6929/m.21564 type:complete len:437 (-) Transcript_6929:63-1373(-)